MMADENRLEELKKHLYRLHFLLTEKESRETVIQSMEQFRTCYTGIMEQLSDFLNSEHGVQTNSHINIIEAAFKCRMVNEEMSAQLMMMVNDYEEYVSAAENKEFYNSIKENYAGYLQTIHDMLSRMGLDAEDEEKGG